MLTEQLQQLGLTKYEAEGYLALLRQGALTGYELGKRSAVPLSRSYEALERLVQKGFALTQPGEPPRYTAVAPEAIIARARDERSRMLDFLTANLTSVADAPPPSGYWVARGTTAITTEAAALIGAASARIEICGIPDDLDRLLMVARERGCRVTVRPDSARGDTIALLIDERRALLGSLTPADDCQAIVGSDPALLAAVRALLASMSDTARHAPPRSTAKDETAPLGWLEWETRKQRRLLGLGDTEAA